jgi:hypothetical protein
MFATIYAAILPNIPMLLAHQTVYAKKKGGSACRSFG